MGTDLSAASAAEPGRSVMADGGFMHGQDVLTLLNRDLANEMNTCFMYMADSLLLKGPDARDIQEVTSDFAEQDFGHARRLAVRIVELEGTPELMPINFQNNASIEAKMPSKGASKLALQDALENEMQSVIEYRRQIQNIGFSDPTTRLLLEGILAEKEHQAEALRQLLGL
jgi:bacterioferritin